MAKPDQLRERARKYRALASGADERTASNLLMLAAEYEAEADRLDRREQPR